MIATAPTNKPGVGINCRVWERLPCEVDSSCQPVAARGPNEMTWGARIRDVSPGGIGLVAVRRFEPGTGLAIQVPGAGDDEGETLLAKVVHVQRLADGGYLLGCRFISELSEDEVQRIVGAGRRDAAAPAGGGEHVVTNLRWQHAETGATLAVRRLTLRGAWPLAPGKLLKVWLHARGGEAESTGILVRSCTRHGGEWVVRFSFVGRPFPALQRCLRHGTTPTH